MGFIEKVMPEKVVTYLDSTEICSLETKQVEIIQKVAGKWVKDECLYFNTKIEGIISEIGVFLGNIKDINEKINRAIETMIIHRNRMTEIKEKDIETIVCRSKASDLEEGLGLKKNLFETKEGTYVAITVDVWQKGEEYKEKAEAELEKTIKELNEFVELGALVI